MKGYKVALALLLLAAVLVFLSGGCSVLPSAPYSNWRGDDEYRVNLQDVQSAYRLTLDLARETGGPLGLVGMPHGINKDSAAQICWVLGLAIGSIEPNGWVFTCKK